MSVTDITFHPEWWVERGFSFQQRFFTDWHYRMECDRDMRRVLYEEYGDYGLGEKEPEPRPLVDSDLLAGEFVQAQVLGCDVQFSDRSLPFTPPLNLSNEQAVSLKPADLSKNAVWRVYDEQYKQLISEFGYVESYMDLHGVQNLGIDLRGNLLFEDYFLEEELAKHVLDIACQTIMSVAEAICQYTRFMSSGVTAIVGKVDPSLYVTSNCTCEMVSAAVYDRFLAPFDARLKRRFTPFGIHHCGQTMEHLAKSYAKLQPDFIEVGAHSDIEATLRHFPVSTKINLRYHPRDLSERTPEQIRADVLDMKRKAGTHPFVTISAVGVDARAPRQAIGAFLEAAGTNG